MARGSMLSPVLVRLLQDRDMGAPVSHQALETPVLGVRLFELRGFIGPHPTVLRHRTNVASLTPGCCRTRATPRRQARPQAKTLWPGSAGGIYPPTNREADRGEPSAKNGHELLHCLRVNEGSSWANKAEVITISDHALYAQVSKSSLCKLAQCGTVPGQQIGKHGRFSRALTDGWLTHGPGYYLSGHPVASAGESHRRSGNAAGSRARGRD